VDSSELAALRRRACQNSSNCYPLDQIVNKRFDMQTIVINTNSNANSLIFFGIDVGTK